MIRCFTSLLMAFVLCSSAFAAKDGYEIKFQIANYDNPEVYLAYYMGDKQYIKDTLKAEKPGYFTAKGDTALKAGLYLAVLPPDNKFFQVLITDQEQFFSMSTDTTNLVKNMKIKGSPDNSLFYEYVNFLGTQSDKVEPLRKKMEGLPEGDAEKKKAQDEIDAIDKVVKKKQLETIAKMPNSMTAILIKANLSIDFPEFTGTEDEQQTQRWRYMQNHYFDNFDLTDSRLLRTPFLFQRLDYFVHKLQVQHPDTIAKSIVYVLDRLKPAKESFQYYLIHFVNEAAKSKIVGMDAIYVELVEKYYTTNDVSWSDSTTRVNLIREAASLKPLLLGKVAPDLLMQDRDGLRVNLHGVKADYTVLYFWRYDCGHCKENTPKLRDFYEKYKDKGVKIFAVCSKFTDEVPACWDYIKEHEIGNWMHVVDPYHISKYNSVYNIKATPMIYLLDSKKEIISKGISPEQIAEVIEHHRSLGKEK